MKSRRNPKRIAAIQAKDTEKYSLMKGTKSIYRGKINWKPSKTMPYGMVLEVFFLLYFAHKENRTHYDDKGGQHEKHTEN